MTDGIIGKKLGMTQVFGEGGKSEAVTAIEAGPCTVTQIKTEDNDGYSAVQLGFGEPKQAKKAKKSAKDKAPAGFKFVREFKFEDPKTLAAGQKLDVSIFKAGDKVDIIGISKGKGFAGGVKRYHFHGGPKTHGQSDRWRAHGSVGSNTTPGRVFLGLRMAGHMGSERVTASNLTVYQTDPARNLILIKGAVPGATNGIVMVQKSRKGKK
ncbi:MAG TPA: 50S ribosomal protein L3 [Dehalococcoidales bacterium]|nr:50S ribosomal protein L3 [Dehalococcoidales bacterium]